MSASLVGSEMCIRDRQSAFSIEEVEVALASDEECIAGASTKGWSSDVHRGIRTVGPQRVLEAA
eukprot:2610932-Alexandrium_andersonii.AAC.1